MAFHAALHSGHGVAPLPPLPPAACRSPPPPACGPSRCLQGIKTISSKGKRIIKRKADKKAAKEAKAAKRELHKDPVARAAAKAAAEEAAAAAPASPAEPLDEAALERKREKAQRKKEKAQRRKLDREMKEADLKVGWLGCWAAGLLGGFRALKRRSPPSVSCTGCRAAQNLPPISVHPSEWLLLTSCCCRWRWRHPSAGQEASQEQG